MENVILTPQEFQKLTETMSKTINSEGIMTVNSAVLIITFIVLFLLMVGIVIFLIKAFMNSQRELIQQQNEFTTQSLRKIENGFSGLNLSIEGLYTLVNDDKKFNRDDFRSISTISSTNTILWIYIKIMLIIERNNLVKNEDTIITDIKNTIEKFILDGRRSLKEIGFELDIQDKFFQQTDKLKDDAFLEIRTSFTASIFRIKDIQDKLDRFKKSIFDKDIIQKAELILYLESYEELRYQLADEYSLLKRNIYNISENIVTQTKDLISRL